MNQLDEVAKNVGGKKKNFLSSKMKKQGATVTGYFLYNTIDEIEGNYYHKETAYFKNEAGEIKEFYPLVICNSGDDRKSKCVLCDHGSRKVAGAQLQFYIPDEDETYILERKNTQLVELNEWFSRIPEGVSILQQPFTIRTTVVSPREYSIIPGAKQDKKVLDNVQAAYEDRHNEEDLYRTLSNESMEMFLSNGNRFDFEPDTAKDDDDEDEDTPF